jgi:hypothetical protein
VDFGIPKDRAVTYLDDSANRTLDNANEGIMSNEFEKWFAGEHGVPQDCRVFARAAYQFRQSEIDALNVALLAEQTKCAGFAPVVSRLLEENTALKAENERLLPYVDAFRREEGRADKLDRKVDELNAENERLRKDAERHLPPIDERGPGRE